MTVIDHPSRPTDLFDTAAISADLARLAESYSGRERGSGKGKNATSGEQGHDDLQRETAAASLHAHTID